MKDLRYWFSVITVVACASCGDAAEETQTTTVSSTSSTSVTSETIDYSIGNFYPDQVVQVEIEMDETDWDELRNQSRGFADILGGEDCMDAPFESPYTYFPADVTIDGEFMANVGVRKKALIGSQSTSKPGLKLNIDEYVDGAELFGVDNITLNNSVQDPSLIKQCMGYAVFADGGAPASRCNFARVAVNGNDLGIYVHVDPIKRAYLRTHFGNDNGDLYEGTLSDFRDGWQLTFDPKTDDTDPNLTAVWAISEALTLPDNQLLAALSELIDMDEFYTFWALESIIGHWDGYAGNTNNFYIYVDPSDGLVRFIPWGIDGTMYADGAYDGPMSAGVLANRLLGLDESSAMLSARIEALLAEVWDEEALLAEVDRMEDLLASEIDISDISDYIEDVRSYISQRNAGLTGSLPGEPWELGDIACMTEMGELSATFSTTWDSLSSQDPTTYGDLDISFVYDGWVAEFASQGVTIGPDEGYNLLLFGGLISPVDGSLIYVYFLPNTADIVAGGTTDVGTGGVMYTDNSLGGYLYTIAYMGNGSVQFDAGAPEADAEVSGTVTATMFGWE